MTAKTLRLAHKLFLRYREFSRRGEEKICVRWRDCALSREVDFSSARH